MKPFLSIVTPVYNSTRTLKSYLEAIFNNQYQDFELIIVDDLSNDSPWQIIKDYNVIYVRSDHQGGSASARNKGEKVSNGEVILFLDPDIVIPPTALGDIVDVFKKNQGIAGLIGSYDDAPGGENITSQFKFLFHHYTHQQEGDYIDTFWTGCGAIRKDVFDRLGGFNAAFLDGNSVHDIEFGYRLKKNKYKVYNAKHVLVKHLKILDFVEWVFTDMFYRGIPWIMIMLRHKDLSLKLNTRINNVLSLLCVWGIVFLLGFSFFNGTLICWAFVFLALFIVINRGLISFFIQKKGFVFSVISIFYLFVYYINCGLCLLAAPFYYAQ